LTPTVQLHVVTMLVRLRRYDDVVLLCFDRACA